MFGNEIIFEPDHDMAVIPSKTAGGRRLMAFLPLLHIDTKSYQVRQQSQHFCFCCAARLVGDF